MTTPVIPPPPAASSPPGARTPVRVWRGAVIVAGLALVTRAPWLGRPGVFVFDEIFYASDAVDLLRHGVEGGSPAHPPLGKWMIAGGVRLLGFDAWGWRLVPLLTGAAVAALTWVLGWRVTGRRRGATIASAFVLFDGISVVTGRLALLDGLVALWTTLAVLTLVGMVERPLDVLVQRRHRRWLGVWLGLALATKWTAAALAPVVLVTVIAIDHLRPAGSRLVPALRSLVSIAAVVVAVYGVVHVPWLVNHERTPAAASDCTVASCPAGLFERVGGVIRHQVDMLDYHRTLEPTQRDAASALHWVVQTRPTRLLVKECGPELAPHAGDSDGLCAGDATTEVRIVALGNPVGWVVATLALVAMIGVVVRRRDGVVAVVVACAVMMWLPWLIGGRPGFSFYAAPLVPLLGVVVAAGVEALPTRWARWWPVLPVALGAVALVLWPLWIAMPLSPGAADRLLWFSGWR